ncbi:MAG: histidine kinase [Hymenobacter sp.]|nr:MAG: histidine kinase [Hymenobacter sp.]
MPTPAPPALPLRDRRLVVGGLALISLVMTLASGGWAFRSAVNFGITWSCSLIYTLVLGLGNRALWQALQRRYPLVSQTRRRLWWLALASVAYTSTATVAVTLGLSVLGKGSPSTSPQALLLIAGINLVPTLIGQLIYESRHAFQQWAENQHRADQLAQASTQAQLDALAQQLDPHFLFNSLNTLAALIEPANEPAQHYVEGLADVYRYVLLSRERATVPLAEELAFVQTYVALQKVRFRENVQVSYDLPPAALTQRVAPLSVQLLVENALKHNEASQARPLHLRLVARADTLRVENTYQPRPAGLAPGTGTGLANVRQRYALLGAGQAVEITQAGGIFVVALPLLPA